MTVDLSNEEPSQIKGEAETSAKREHADKKDDEYNHVIEDPVPSTSRCSEKESKKTIKKYKKSMPYLQYTWCQHQPAFQKLKNELSNRHK